MKMSGVRYVISHGRRIEVETLDVGATPKRRKQCDAFVMLSHRDAVAGFSALGCPAALVWCALIFRAWEVKSNTIRVPTALLRSWGVSRWAWQRALAKLDRRGLIRIDEFKPGRAAQVTLLLRG
jgi:hypothetical protein